MPIFRTNTVLLFLLLGTAVSAVDPESLRADDGSLTIGDVVVDSQYQSGLDYLHFWLIPRAIGRSGAINIYSPDVQRKIFDEFRKEQQADRTRAIHDPVDGTELQNLDSVRLIYLLDQYERRYQHKLEPTGTPFFYSLLTIQGLDSFEFDYQLYQWISNVLFVIGVVWLGRVAGIEWFPLLIVTILVIPFFRPWSTDVGVANTNRIQVFLFAAATGFLALNQFNFFMSGLAIGLAIAFKPNFALIPLFSVSYLLAERKHTAAFGFFAGVAGGIGIALVVSAHCFGDVHCWVDWRRYLQQVMEQPYDLKQGNYTLVRLWGTVYQWLVVVAITLAWSALLVRRFLLSSQTRTEEHSRTFAMASATALLAMLMVSPLVWSHYYLLTLPAVLLIAPCFKRTKAGVEGSRIAGVAVFAAAVLMVSALPITGLAISDPVVISFVLQIGVALLFVVSVFVLWRE